MKRHGVPGRFMGPGGSRRRNRTVPNHAPGGCARGVVRQPVWALMLAVAMVIVWFTIVFVVAPAHADDPKTVAREVGQAGSAAAGAIARDAAKAGTVPGYAGTNLPERGLMAAGMEDAARMHLADPDDPGARAGRMVIEGTAVRPAVPVPANDPGVARARAVEASAQSPAHRADGLASGNVTDCQAQVADAGRGGACGRVSYCVGAGCERVESEGNTGFTRSAAMLNMVLEMGGEEFDRDNLRFFAGQRRACTIKLGGLANCCKNSGLLVGIAGCSRAEIELGKERHAGNTHYLGKRCAKRVFGVCIRRKREWCVFSSKLGRILHQQARPQLGVGWGSCRGFTVAEIERIDFDRLDLTEFTQDLVDGSREPSIAMPDKGDTQTLMRDRVRAFYERSP